jgi:hypothetical protein
MISKNNLPILFYDTNRNQLLKRALYLLLTAEDNKDNNNRKRVQFKIVLITLSVNV